MLEIKKYNELEDSGIDKIIKDKYNLEEDDGISIYYDENTKKFTVSPNINFEFIISYKGKNVSYSKTSVIIYSKELINIINEIEEDMKNGNKSLLDKNLKVYFTNLKKYKNLDDIKVDELTERFKKKIKNFYGVELNNFHFEYYPTLESVRNRVYGNK